MILSSNARSLTGMRGGRGPEGSPYGEKDKSRQWGISSEEIKPDHFLRYSLAVSLAYGRVLDAACGCGYGSSMLYRKTGNVVGVDYDLEAIEWATKYFEGPKYLHAKIEDSPWGGDFDTVVSLETIEHMEDPSPSLKAIRAACRGIFIASVPNQDNYPFIKSKYAKDSSPHFRHYTPKEFEDLLNDHHFWVEKKYCQKSKGKPEVIEGTDGKFIIYVCK